VKVQLCCASGPQSALVPMLTVMRALIGIERAAAPVSRRRGIALAVVPHLLSACEKVAACRAVSPAPYWWRACPLRGPYFLQVRPRGRASHDGTAATVGENRRIQHFSARDASPAGQCQVRSFVVMKVERHHRSGTTRTCHDRSPLRQEQHYRPSRARASVGECRAIMSALQNM